MDSLKIVAIILIVLGIIGLAYGSFTYISETRTADLGLFQVSVQDKETVNIPIWAGVGVIIAGGALLLFSSKKA